MRLISIMVLAAGLGWVGFKAEYHPVWQLPPNLIAKNIMVVGKVVSIDKYQNHNVLFQLRTTQLDHQARSILLRLSWYAYGKLLPPLLHRGECWHLIVHLKPDHGLQNPGSFSYENWLVRQGITATGYIVTRYPQANQIISPPQGWFKLSRWREAIQADIEQAVTDPDMAALITGLTVGYRNKLSEWQWQVLRNTGTNHLMVIAGLHIGLIAAGVYTLFNCAWRLWPHLLLIYPAQRVGAIAALVAAWGYGILSGFSLPTQRAICMMSVFTLAEILNATSSVWHRLLIALAWVLIIEPNALFSTSFWLSFSAIFWIAYGMQGRRWRISDFRLSWLRPWLRMQWVIFLGLLPISLYFFQQLSLVMMVANFVAIPWVGLFVVPLCFLAALVLIVSHSGGVWLFWLAAKLLSLLWWWLDWLARLPHLNWYHAVTHLWILAAALIAILLLLAPRGFPGRWLGGFWLLPLFFYHSASPPLRAVWLTVLDVGQGLAVIVQTATHVLIYDTGPAFPEGFDAGRDVLLPFLRYRNIAHIDRLIVSHGDNDHIGGAAALLASLPIRRILTSIPARLSQDKVQVLACHSGQHWQWDGIWFRMLAPVKNQPYADNNSSCVLQIGRVSGNGGSDNSDDNSSAQILLVGDIEAETEAELVKKYGDHLHTIVLVAPHHGSITSSTRAFVQAVHPQYAIISAGFYNRYHFPAPAVMTRYQAIGAQLMITAKQGAVSLHLPPGL